MVSLPSLNMSMALKCGINFKLWKSKSACGPKQSFPVSIKIIPIIPLNCWFYCMINLWKPPITEQKKFFTSSRLFACALSTGLQFLWTRTFAYKMFNKHMEVLSDCDRLRNVLGRWVGQQVPLVLVMYKKLNAYEGR